MSEAYTQPQRVYKNNSSKKFKKQNNTKANNNPPPKWYFLIQPQKSVVTPASYTGKASGRYVFKSFHFCIRLKSGSVHSVRTLNQAQ